MANLPSPGVADPYLWPEEEESMVRQCSVLNERLLCCIDPSGIQRRSGSAHLHKSLSSSKMSNRAKEIMEELLQDNKEERDNGGVSLPVDEKTTHLCTTVLDSKSMNEATILNLASTGQISLFGSLLSVIDTASTNNATPVTSKYLLQKCAWTVRPSATPGFLDAREMVLAVLLFLSQTDYQPTAHIEDGTIDDHDKHSVAQPVVLPLIRPSNNVCDLERRTYEKSYEWKLDDILSRISVLEWNFLNGDHSPYKWLPRERFLPLTPNDKTKRLLLHKGMTNDINMNQPKDTKDTAKKATKQPPKKRAKKQTKPVGDVTDPDPNDPSIEARHITTTEKQSPNSS